MRIGNTSSCSNISPHQQKVKKLHYMRVYVYIQGFFWRYAPERCSGTYLKEHISKKAKI
jgi:hypothetical protein